MVHAIDTALDGAPKGFASVDVGGASNIFLGGMLYYFMGISQGRNCVVAGKFIGEDGGRARRGNMGSNHGEQGSLLDIRHHLGDCVTFTLYHTHDNRLARCAAPALPGMLTAYVGFVYFDLSGERIDVLSHEFTNLSEHAPRRFVGDTQFPFELLGRDSRLGRSHKEHGMEPRAEWRGGLVKDSSSSRGDAHSAELAGIELHARPFVVLRYLAALLAENTLGPARLEEQVQAIIVGRELLVEIFDCVLTHQCQLLFNLHMEYST